MVCVANWRCSWRGVQPRRMEPATRVSLAILARMFEWRNALVVVPPATLSIGI
jgi:hypothetical protein